MIGVDAGNLPDLIAALFFVAVIMGVIWALRKFISYGA